MSQKKLLITHKPLATQNNCVSAESYQNLIRSGGQNRKSVGISALFSLFGLFPLIKPRKAKSLAVSRILAFSISVVPHNVPQILGVFEVPKNQ